MSSNATDPEMSEWSWPDPLQMINILTTLLVPLVFGIIVFVGEKIEF